MQINWVKKGRIFCVDSPGFAWMHSHAANPFAEPLGDGQYRIYFSSRDAQRRSSIGAFDIDLNDLTSPVRILPEPLVSYGSPGTFDDSGTSMGWLLNKGKERWLYYLGWNLGVTVPWRNSIGLAISPSPGKPFTKVSRAPIMDRSDIDPYSLSYPCVYGSEGNYKMLYGSNLSWGQTEESMRHCLKYAESDDGIHWARNGDIAIAFEDEYEYAMSKPCVLSSADGYQVWYSHRSVGSSYKIGYAESKEGRRWQRRDKEVGISAASEGWDSQSLEYPFVFRHNGELRMLYNGNGYGITGIGLAVGVEVGGGMSLSEIEAK